MCIRDRIWGYDERDVGGEWYVCKETEIYNLNRKDDEWKESLEVYMNDNDYNDLIKMSNPIVNEFNDGNLTKIPNVDWFNEYLNKLIEVSFSGYNTQNSHLCGDQIERCYVEPRLIWNDGG